MRLLTMDGNSRSSLTDAADPSPGSGEVVVETRASVLCGSELPGYRGTGVRGGNNGHEAVGIVVALGAGVAEPALGQRVGVSAIAGCGRCTFCHKGQNTWCAGKRFFGNMHAERFVVPANACLPLPDDVPWEVGALISGDGLGVPYHTWTKLSDPGIDTVAVFGVGPVGLGNVLLQAHLGRRVIAIDVSPARLDLARRLGASDTLVADDGDMAGRVRELTGGPGADACIECAGRPETVLTAVNAVKSGGTVVLNGEQGDLTLSPSEHLIRRDIAMIGSWYYHIGEFPAMLRLFRAGLRVHDLITDRHPFARAPEAFSAFAAGRGAKTALCYGDHALVGAAS